MTEKLTIIDIIDASYLIPRFPEFFIIAQNMLGGVEVMDAEELAIISALGIDGVDFSCGCGAYNRREDAETVVHELMKRKPSRQLYVVGSEDLP